MTIHWSIKGLLALGMTVAAAASWASEPLGGEVPAGTTLTVADQNEVLRTLMEASGEADKLGSEVTYANFLGGPAILEAFRAGALDLAVVGNTPPIQAHASGLVLPIVGAVTTTEVDYHLAVRPGLQIDRLEDLAGKKLSYAEGTGRQPFILNALKVAGLTPEDVQFVGLKAADMPDAVRAGQVDVAVLNEPHYSRYIKTFPGASALPEAEHDRLPRTLSYLYASPDALSDPGKTAAIAQFVRGWIDANRWRSEHTQEWADTYYIGLQRLPPEEGLAAAQAEGEPSFPTLSELVETQQGLIDVIHAAGGLPRHLDASEEFDFRFDAVIAAATDR
ncbi:ABC transporter substrate-binding protein [Aureimonas altamirensis]|uniref:ABC transporter substrate-binding protein n=1 Tax=Aureimonas altamirensis TaxID=370622 RepID=UPI0030189298